MFYFCFHKAKLKHPNEDDFIFYIVTFVEQGTLR